jgi:hypothetical protein
MEGGKIIGVPMTSYVILSVEENPGSDEKAVMARIPYASAVCNLLYAMVATYSNITSAVRVANHSKKSSHWQTLAKSLPTGKP